MSFRALSSTHILATLTRLTQRIEERFPEAGLAHVARDLGELGATSAGEAESLGAPNWPVRLAATAIAVVVLAGSAGAVWEVWPRLGRVSGIADFVQAIEASVNDAVFLGIAIYFLFSFERRMKRRVALKALHQLRSVAHIVDMHQLTKDPERLMSPADDTASSPSRAMTREQLGRYLDYCSELLSLTSKVAALFVQRFDDPVVLQAVNEVESLTNGLSRKIWQKITILENAEARGAGV